MSLRDVNWGAVIVGAAVVTTLAAVAMSSGNILAASPLIEHAGATIMGAALAGGVAGNMTSKLVNRVENTVGAAVGA
ncbi:MAG: hypothetical protein R3D71_00980 [Rickettsiales bacterium]